MRRLVFLTCFLISFICRANVQLPEIFSDGMILQRNQEIPVWGWADAGEKIEVRFKDQQIKTIADEAGKWKVVFKPESHGGPFILEVKAKNTIKVSDVYVGEVWVCSGQSNMEWTVINSQNSQEEIANSEYPLIRQFLVEKDMASSPKEKLKGGTWQKSNPENVGNFTAVGYFFARKIHKELGVPVGIINSSWGGTIVETWISDEALSNNEEFAKAVAGLPKVDLDSLQNVQRQKVERQIESLQGSKIKEIEDSEVSKLGFNDEDWPGMSVPGLWENQQFPNLDGVVWFRKSINLSEDDLGKPAVLKLAKIDDKDETYINGVLVGSKNQYDTERVYNIPEDVLKAGENIIAVKITDYSGGGGIYGNAENIVLEIGEKKYSLSGSWKFLVNEVATQFSPNSYPSLLYNAMIHPFIPYSIRGVLWYQGESNVGRAVQYKKSFPLLINDWRSKWGQGSFPFYFVQLSSFDEFGDSNKGSKWAELREAQTFTSETIENTGMAVTTDIGNATDIHPRNKQDVGKRLAAIALNKNYGFKNVYSGPKLKKSETIGNQIIISFDHIGGGLITGNGENEVRGFEIAGPNKKFFKAQAVIEDDQVIVKSINVEEPVSVRFGWADDAGNSNLFNEDGFPAVPFRTDDWELSTSRIMYNGKF